MITTIIFDLSEVYLNGLKGTEKKLLKRSGNPLSNGEMFLPELEKLFHGQIPEEEYFQALIERYNLSMTVGDIVAIVRDNFQVIEGTRVLIESLRDQGYRLGLLSVHAREWIEHCEREFDYHKLFDSVLYSFEVAVCKPEHKAYELILERLGALPEECVFIDDSLQNIIAAQELGILGIQFHSAAQVFQELKGAGVCI